MQVHGSLLQVRHLLEAHSSSLQSSEAHAVLPQTAALLLERLWLATPLCGAPAVRAAYLRAAGALLAAGRAAEPLSGQRGDDAVSALARGVMGVCQETLIGQDPTTAPDHPSAPTSPPHQGLTCSTIARAAAQPALDAGSSSAGSNRLQDGRTGTLTTSNAAPPQPCKDRHSSSEHSEPPMDIAFLDAAGADGADAMRSIFLKEAALLYFSPAMQCLGGREATGGRCTQLRVCHKSPDVLHATCLSCWVSGRVKVHWLGLRAAVCWM